jgi:eukaryotic-like serine/threonine-protein kinase
MAAVVTFANDADPRVDVDLEADSHAAPSGAGLAVSPTRRERKAVADLAKREQRARQARERAARKVDRESVGRRRRWPYAVVSLLLVAVMGAGGAYWWVNLRIPYHAMPVLVGRDVSEIDSLIGSFGWIVVRRPDQYADGTHPGQILSQQPAVSTEVKKGDSVRIVVSSGPPPVDVPADLAGQKLDAAGAVLAQRGLVVGDIKKLFSESVPLDSVIALANGTPAQLPRGSKVGLTVSAGPEPRTIPDGLVGKPVDQATATLKSLGLVVVPTDEFSNAIVKGNVIAVNPGVGNRAERGSTVQLTVSKGPETVAVPDVKGMSVIDAATAIEEAGLQVNDTRGSPRRRVVLTDPVAGTQVEKGTKITLITAD